MRRRNLKVDVGAYEIHCYVLIYLVVTVSHMLCYDPFLLLVARTKKSC